MKYKLLLTGKNQTLIDIFFTQLDNDFEIVSSSLYPKDIEQHIRYFDPELFVYCASGDSREIAGKMTEVKDMLAIRGIPFILAGTENDCSAFERAAAHVSDLTLIRLTPTAIRDKITAFVERQQEPLEQDAAPAKPAAPGKAESSKPAAPGKAETPAKPSAAGKGSSFSIPSATDRILDVFDSPDYMEALDILSSPAFMESLGLSAADCIERPASATSPAPAPANNLGSSIFRKHVLVIDDDPQILKLIKEHLHEKYEVATAISGKIALKFLENKRTDLILLDYEMPDENGAVVMEKLRAKSSTRFIPVIFLTGVADREKIQSVLALKPQNYLLKPIDRAILLDAIAKVIG